MALSNSQYDMIMQQYEALRARRAAELEARRKAAYEKVPGLSMIEEKTADSYAERARALILGRDEDAAAADARIKDLCESREVLLRSAGICPEDMKLKYECELCGDTGLIDGRKCTCFRRREAELLYDASNIRELLSRENFAAFNFDYFDREKIDAFSGKTAFENMQEVYAKARSMADEFVPGDVNLLLMGPSGCGKTFLSNCIAKEVLDKGCSVLYFSAQTLFDRLASERFSEHNIGEAGMIFGADLLIIDDLGTEINNSFVSSQLFNLINERRAGKVSTVISTNLDLNALRDTYSERVSSRLIDGYTCLRMFNPDIRILKKMQ